MLIAVTHESNQTSRRLLERVGATPTGTYEQNGTVQVRYEVGGRTAPGPVVH